MRSRNALAVVLALVVPAAILALAALGGVQEASAQATRPDTKAAVAIPEETGAGVWDGAYAYLCRDFKIALWIRTRDGVPEMKLRYSSLQLPEEFETDWNGKATYYMGGNPGTFELAYKSRDAKRIEGGWHWEIQATEEGRVEDASFTAYRAGVGRSVVFKFDKFEREMRKKDAVRKIPFVPPPVWTFRKVSKRTDVLWEEFPF
jgi:hypothetical protein